MPRTNKRGAKSDRSSRSDDVPGRAPSDSRPARSSPTRHPRALLASIGVFVCWYAYLLYVAFLG